MFDIIKLMCDKGYSNIESSIDTTLGEKGNYGYKLIFSPNKRKESQIFKHTINISTINNSKYYLTIKEFSCLQLHKNGISKESLLSILNKRKFVYNGDNPNDKQQIVIKKYEKQISNRIKDLYYSHKKYGDPLESVEEILEDFDLPCFNGYNTK